METITNTVFSSSTSRKLEKLFRVLPEVFFWTVIATRLFISVPLGKAAMKHFEFLELEWLIIANSVISVLIVESVLTLPSLSTAFFKRYDMGRYQTVAFWTTIVLGMFNQSLIMLAWRDTDMGTEAFYMYTVFNVASIILAEFIGFMMQKPAKVQVGQQAVTVQSKEESRINFTETERSRTVSIPSEKVREILGLELEDGEKMHRLAELGLSQRKIAPMFQMSAAKANRILNSWKTRQEQTNGENVHQEVIPENNT